MIEPPEIERVIFEGEVIEDYPGARRGHTVLLHGFGIGGRPIHVVCAPKEDHLAVVTAYLPDPSVWIEDLKKRSK